MTSYRRLQQYAIAISILSILYNGAEGAVSIGLGAESSSRSLVFFGIQSGIEVASAAVVLWRFRKVAKPGEESEVVLSEEQLRVERIGTWGIGILIALLALATEITAILGLARHDEPDASNAALIISASALVIMILIWLPKRTLARLLNSSTMAGEATCSLSCIQITIVLFVGALVFRLWHGGWWVDSATSLVLGLLFAREAWKMLSWVRNPEFNGGCCDDCANPLSRIGVGKDAELEEQYRDLCECCYEKEECRNGDTCKCDASESEVEQQDSCCVPKAPSGKACCTRELIQGPRPERTPQEDDKCCSKKNVTTSGDRDPEPEPERGRGCNSCCDEEAEGDRAEPKTKADSCCAPATASAPSEDIEAAPQQQPKSCCQKGCC